MTARTNKANNNSTDKGNNAGNGSPDIPGGGGGTDDALAAIHAAQKASSSITAAQTTANGLIMAGNATATVTNAVMAAAVDTVSGVAKLVKDAVHSAKEAAEKST